MEIKNVYIFNCGVNENGIKIINDIDSLKEFLIDAPVCVNNTVIGIVAEVTDVIGDKIYGTVLYFEDEYKEYKYFKNYEVQADINFEYNREEDITELIINNISAIYLTNN